jgi:formate hydrogenlyase subunit 4
VTFLLNLLQALLLLAGAPLVTGLVSRLKARLQGRQGASLWRPYAELVKLFHKQETLAEPVSWYFSVAPRLSLAAMAVAALLVPVLAPSSLMGSGGDLVLLVYLFALSRFAVMLGSLDSGSPFAGIGASREALVAALAEMPLLLGLIAVALPSHSTALLRMTRATLGRNFLTVSPVHLLALSALILVALAEAGRMPVDNPASHLEVTMIHHAMTLEYSGASLACLEYAGSLKLNLLMALLIALFCPWGMAASPSLLAIAFAVGAYMVKLLLLAAGIAVLESSVAKLRMYRVPEYLGIASAISVLAILFTVVGGF